MSEIKQDAILSQRLLDAQVGVLGSMLIDPDTVPEVLSRVRDADFAEEKYRLVFQAIQARFRAGQAIDPILVRETLGGGVDSPWTSILQGLMDVTTTAAHVDDYVDALRASVTLSNLRTLGTQLAEADRLEDAQTLLEQVDIVLRREHLELPGSIILCQIRAAQHVQKMQLDPVHTDLSQMACRLHDHFRRLAGKSQNHVRNDLDI